MIDVIETLNAAVNARADAQTAAAVAAQVATDAATMTAHLADDVAAFAAKDALIEARDDTISTQIATIASLNGQISTLNGQIVGLNDQIAALQIETDVDEAQIASLTSQIATLNSQVASLNAQIAALQATAAQNSAQIAALQAHETTHLATPLDWREFAGTRLEGLFDSDEVADGIVADWASTVRVTRHAVQATAINQPTKTGRGVYFAKGATQWLQWPFDSSHSWFMRNFVIECDIDAAGGTGSQLISTFHGILPNNVCHQPSVTANKTNNTLEVRFNDQLSRVLTGPLLQGRNFAVCRRVGGKVYANINGTESVSDLLSLRPNNTSAPSYMGSQSVSTIDRWITTLAWWDGEMSDDEWAVAVGIAAWRQYLQGTLAAGHRFKTTRPTHGTTIARTQRYAHNAAQWATYAAASQNEKWLNRGKPTMPDFSGYAVEKRWDFSTPDQMPINCMSYAPGYQLYAPMWLDRGGEAKAQGSNFSVNVNTLVLDTANKMLSIKLLWDGSAWRTSAVATYNHNGDGWSVGGEYVARTRIRIMGNRQDKITSGADAGKRVGLFPGWWGYDKWHLHNADGHRLEFDNWEGTGKSGQYYDAGLIVHANRRPPLNPPADVRTRTGNYTLVPANGWDPGVDIMDEQWHDLVEAHIGGRVTVWCDGREVYSVPTYPAWQEPRMFIWDMAKDIGHGDRQPATTEVFSFDIASFDILRPV